LTADNLLRANSQVSHYSTVAPLIPCCTQTHFRKNIVNSYLLMFVYRTAYLSRNHIKANLNLKPT